MLLIYVVNVVVNINPWIVNIVYKVVDIVLINDLLFLIIFVAIIDGVFLYKKRIYIPVDTYLCLLPHLLKIQRLSEARVSGGNGLRSTESEPSEQDEIYKISAQRARR